MAISIFTISPGLGLYYLNTAFTREALACCVMGWDMQLRKAPLCWPGYWNILCAQVLPLSWPYLPVTCGCALHPPHQARFLFLFCHSLQACPNDEGTLIYIFPHQDGCQRSPEVAVLNHTFQMPMESLREHFPLKSPLHLYSGTVPSTGRKENLYIYYTKWCKHIPA